MFFNHLDFEYIRKDLVLLSMKSFDQQCNELQTQNGTEIDTNLYSSKLL